MERDEYAIILEYLPHGYPLERSSMMPVAQAIGENNLTLLALVPRRGMSLDIGERAYIGTGKRDKINFILGRLKKEKLTEGAKKQLEEFVDKLVKEKGQKFVDFFNKSDAVNMKIHQLELIPGLGKIHMKEILKERDRKEFESFDDLKNRIANIPDPEKMIVKRILKELVNYERYNLFVR